MRRQLRHLKRVALRTKRDFDYAAAPLTYSIVARRFARAEPTSDLAVVVHVFYLDVWPSISNALSRLSAPYDLFLTVSSLKALRSLSSSPNLTAIAAVPNVGRDVLPFISVSQQLLRLGYTSVLKLHTKKSTHFAGGVEWRESMLSSLLPSQEAIDRTLALLSKPETGVVGPSDYYYRADAGGDETMRLMAERLFQLRPDIALETMRNLKDYGFFAGTMFWARLDALRDLLPASPRDFSPERGQIDGTTAHAFERLLTLLPAIDQRVNYGMEMDAAGLKRLGPKDVRIPEWFAKAAREKNRVPPPSIPS